MALLLEPHLAGYPPLAAIYQELSQVEAVGLEEEILPLLPAALILFLRAEIYHLRAVAALTKHYRPAPLALQVAEVLVVLLEVVLLVAARQPIIASFLALPPALPT